MNKFLHAGGSSALAVALLFGLGDGSAALAQVSTQFPVVSQAVPAVAAALPATNNLPKGNIYTLPLRPAPAPAPVQAAPAAGQPLTALVAANSTGPALDAEGTCLATAVYFESMGESLEGQLAVAQVVINRARSGKYPTTLCAVVKQKAQFSFVRAGQFPRVDAGCEAWRKAQAIARIASAEMAKVIPTDVLWYHADYVAPSWGRRLARVEKIGAHIFYRA